MQSCIVVEIKSVDLLASILLDPTMPNLILFFGGSMVFSPSNLVPLLRSR